MLRKISNFFNKAYYVGLYKVHVMHHWNYEIHLSVSLYGRYNNIFPASGLKDKYYGRVSGPPLIKTFHAMSTCFLSIWPKNIPWKCHDKYVEVFNYCEKNLSLNYMNCLSMQVKYLHLTKKFFFWLDFCRNDKSSKYIEKS